MKLCGLVNNLILQFKEDQKMINFAINFIGCYQKRILMLLALHEDHDFAIKSNKDLEIN